VDVLRCLFVPEIMHGRALEVFLHQIKGFPRIGTTSASACQISMVMAEFMSK
jgi:hypothetical protein